MRPLVVPFIPVVGEDRADTGVISGSKERKTTAGRIVECRHPHRRRKEVASVLSTTSLAHVTT